MLANQARLDDIPIPPSCSVPTAQVLDQAFLAGFRLVMLTCAFSAWCGGLAVLLLLQEPRPA